MGLIDSSSDVAAIEPKTPAAMSPAALMAAMHLPPNMVKPFQAVVLAGMKVLFSDQTHAQMMKQIEAPGPMPEKLGQGIAALMALLFQESKRSIAPQLLIPGGIVLMAHAADFLNKSGMAPVSPQDFGDAMQIMVETIMKAFKVDPDQVQSKIQTMQQAPAKSTALAAPKGAM